MNKQKRIMAIHDISCFGKCSLTVALPIISACGIETSVIPTAVLSTHTGGFTDFTYRDLTEDITPIADHWKSLNLKFDGIYTGFLGSFEQIDIVEDTIKKFKTNDTLVVIDTVMADNGKLYSIFPDNFPRGMKKLCKYADIIVPNITEATLMLEEPYVEGPYTQEYIEGLLKRLPALGAKKIVLTGVHFDNENLGAAAYDSETGEISYSFEKKIDGYYHGTGDVFASALVGAVLKGCSLKKATEIAVSFTRESIKRTAEAKTDIRFGVNFEEGLKKLVTDIEG